MIKTPTFKVGVFLCPTAPVHYVNAAKHHGCCQNLLPCQQVHAEDNADECGDYRLDIAVHAYKGRADMLLAKWDEEVCQECGKDYEVR